MIKRKGLALVVSILLICTVLLSACSSNNSTGSTAASSSQTTGSSSTASTAAPVSAKDEYPAINITFGTPFAEAHPFSAIDKEWMAKLKEKANITVQPFFSGTLVSLTTPYQEVINGVADAVHIIPGGESDHFYVANAIQAFYSWGTKTPRVVYETVCDLYNQSKDFSSEYKGVVPYGICNLGEPMYLITKTPIRTLADLKGKSIRIAADEQAALITAFGGEPIRLQVPEMMESLQKGVIDGVMLGAESLQSMHFAEVCKYATALKLVAAFSVQKFISEKTFNKFTDAQKTVFNEVSKEYDYKSIDAGLASEQSAMKYAKEAGVEFITLTDDEYVQINKVMSDHADKVVKEMNAKGYDGTGLYKLTRSLLEKYEKEYGKK